MNQFTKQIAAQLNLKEQAVENTLALLEEGCTIPFISRYRKEKTGNMDEVNIEAIAQAQLSAGSGEQTGRGEKFYRGTGKTLG